LKTVKTLEKGGYMHSEVKHSEIHSPRDALAYLTVFPGRADWRRLSFFLGMPTLLAIYGVLNNIEALQNNGLGNTIVFYMAHAYVPWWVTCLSTRLIFVCLARWQPVAPVLWVLGAMLSSLILIPYLAWIGEALSGGLSPAANSMDAGDFVVHFIRALFIWVLLNYLFERFIGLPRYRYTSPPSENKVVHSNASIFPVEAGPESILEAQVEHIELPEFLLNTGKIDSIEDLYSISAEEHYIRVRTLTGDALVYKRFSDAVDELKEMNGIRIHRSHWVSPYAVKGVIRDGKRMAVRLKDGNELPVSRPYQSVVRSLASSSCHKPGAL
jgi:DNA-binding LytR/AlgR family response regulator